MTNTQLAQVLVDKIHFMSSQNKFTREAIICATADVLDLNRPQVQSGGLVNNGRLNSMNSAPVIRVGGQQ